MKSFWAHLLILIAFINVAASSEAGQCSSFEGAIAASESAMSVDHSDASVADTHKQDGEEDHGCGCGDEQGKCSNCGPGHCTFTVDMRVSAVALQTFAYVSVGAEFGYRGYDPASAIRPPIA